MAESSRRGKKIARRACDLCRDRRVLCAFDDETISSCRQCLRVGGPCTFLTERKPRGPPSRLAAEAKQRAQEAVQSSGPRELPLGIVTIGHFISEPVMLKIIGDFVLRVYPVLPIVHVPSFTAALDRRDYETDPAFFRLCISLCAVTAASIPRNVSGCYGSGWYHDAGDMVDRASHVVLLSRVATTPGWQNGARIDAMVVSILLAMASHYAGRSNAGWAYASEAIHFFRELELYKEEAYHGLDPFDRELCKRSFWLLFVIQIHDRMSFTIPHTGLSYDPQRTDWDFLLPLEINDHELVDNADVPVIHTRQTPVIAGFIALIKVFLCIVDLLDKSFPGPPPYFGLSAGSLPTVALQDWEGGDLPVKAPPELPILETLFRVMTRLDATLKDMPESLALRGRRARIADEQPRADMTQFDIMRANIHITAIYFQSLILEMCLNKVNTPAASRHAASTERTVNSQLWQMKESVARELLDILGCSSASVLESNGSSMVNKIREIAATFLSQEPDICQDVEMNSVERRSRQYIARFIEILAELDYVPQA